MNKRNRITLLAVILIIAGGIVWALTQKTDLPDLAAAQQLLSEKADSIVPSDSGEVIKYIKSQSKITAEKVHTQDGTTYIQANIKSIDLYSVVKDNYEDILAIDTPDASGETKKSDQLKADITKMLLALADNAEETTQTIDVRIYNVDGKWRVYADEDFADACYGGMAKLSSELKDSEVKVEKRLKTCILVNTDTNAPDTRNVIVRKWDDLKDEFILNFIDDNRWMHIVKGLGVTLEVTFFAVLIGIVLGFIVAIIRCTYDKTKKLRVLNWLCKLYLTVIRGTPVLTQLMIIYFVIFAPFRVSKVIVAIIAFGINSGAYVAEIVRGGIMSIDAGQTEAGRSLGFNYMQTMYHIVIPQAFKAVLPALANEFIVLIKETSVSAYIGLNDLTRGGDIIRGVTYTAFMPLIAVALIYLCIVMILSYFVTKLERRLRKGDNR